MACSICKDARTNKFTCPDCCNQGLESGRGQLKKIQERNDRLAEKLRKVLEVKTRSKRRRALLEECRQKNDRTGNQGADVERALRIVRFECQNLSRENDERRQRLKHLEYQVALADQRRQAEHAARSHGASAVHLAYLHRLIQEQQAKLLARVRILFPMRVIRLDGEDGDLGEETATYICNLPLPMPMDDVMQLTRHSPQSSALGYLALLLSLMAQLLDVPVLMRSSFLGSTTSVWSLRGWWDPDDSPPEDALPVQHSRAETGFVAGVLAAAGGADESTMLNSEATFRDATERVAEAVALLSRAGGMLCYAACGGAVPARYGATPFAWLASLCDEMGDARSGTAVRSALARANAGASLERTHGARDGTASSSRPNVALAASTWGGITGGKVDDDGAEGWEIMPRPSYGRLIPPPPSATDDVEHWAHAMYGTPAPAAGTTDVSPSAAARYVRSALHAQTWITSRFGWQK